MMNSVSPISQRIKQIKFDIILATIGSGCLFAAYAFVPLLLTNGHDSQKGFAQPAAQSVATLAVILTVYVRSCYHMLAIAKFAEDSQKEVAHQINHLPTDSVA